MTNSVPSQCLYCTETAVKAVIVLPSDCTQWWQFFAVHSLGICNIQASQCTSKYFANKRVLKHLIFSNDRYDFKNLSATYKFLCMKIMIIIKIKIRFWEYASYVFFIEFSVFSVSSWLWVLAESVSQCGCDCQGGRTENREHSHRSHTTQNTTKCTQNGNTF